MRSFSHGSDRHVGRRHRLGARHAAGFTLIELMVTVAIVGILSAVAYPAYTDYILRGRLVDATNALSATQASMEQYYQDNRTYLSTKTATSPCASDVTVKTFTVGCGKNLTASTYTITATGSGPTANFVYTLDYQNKQGSTVNSAWGGSSYSCWIMKRGDSC